MKSLISSTPGFLLFLAIVILNDACSKSDALKVQPNPTTPVPPTQPGTPADTYTYRAVSAFPKLSFRNPVDLQNSGDQTDRIFVIEQSGVISVFANDSAVAVKNTFLDISGEVQSSGNEQGLLGLAFHPQFKSNGYFFVNYTATNPERSVISRFTVSSADVNKADPASELILLTYPQPFANHNAGQLAFGPDGYLYIAVGDGGSGGDPNGNGQNRATLLGKILRVDVNGKSGATPYAIPSNNPFAGNGSGYREEIFAVGMRNPWRLSFDAVTGTLFAGDVGQDHYEEIDIIEKGKNYGWNKMEAMHCYNSSTCDETGLTLPIFEYDHTEGNAVIGGHIYRGSYPGLTGYYIYSDNGSHHVWKLDVSNPASPTRTLLFDVSFAPSSFGVDESNELMICGLDGKIYRLKRSS